MPDHQDNKSSLTTKNVLSTFSAGLLRTALLHPLDTTAKRLQYNHMPIKNLEQFMKTITGPRGNLQSMYQGLGWAAVNRTGQFAMLTLTLPCLQGVVERNMGGKSISSDLVSSGILGTGEAVALLFPDAKKVRAQTRTAPDFQYVNPYNRHVIGTTSVRNYAFYATNVLLAPIYKEALKNHAVFGETNQDKPNTAQHVLGNTAATLSGVIASTPWDVIRTRLITQPHGSKKTALDIAQAIYEKEGASAFLKGTGPQLTSKTLGFFAFFALEAAIRNKLTANETTNPADDLVTKSPSKPG